MMSGETQTTHKLNKTRREFMQALNRGEIQGQIQFLAELGGQTRILWEGIELAFKPEPPRQDARTFDRFNNPTHKTLVLTAEQYRVVQRAWNRMKELEGDNVTKGQTVELCCADYLAGA